jgi:prevent-host-death family protein
MGVVSVSKLKDALSEYLNRAAYGGERIIVTSRDKPKAAVISVADLEHSEELEDAQAAREALAAYQVGETVPYEEFRTELMTQGLLDEAD